MSPVTNPSGSNRSTKSVGPNVFGGGGENLFTQAAEQGPQIQQKEKVLAWNREPRTLRPTDPGDPLVTHRWQEFVNPFGFDEKAAAAQADLQNQQQRSLAEQKIARQALGDVKGARDRGMERMAGISAKFDVLGDEGTQDFDALKEGFEEARQAARDLDARTQQQVQDLGTEVRSYRDESIKALEDTVMNEFAAERRALDNSFQNELSQIDNAARTGQIASVGGLPPSTVANIMKTEARARHMDALRDTSSKISVDYAKTRAQHVANVNAYTSQALQGLTALGAQTGAASVQALVDLARAEPAAREAYRSRKLATVQAQAQLETVMAQFDAAQSTTMANIRLSDQYMPDAVALTPYVRMLEQFADEELARKAANQPQLPSIMPAASDQPIAWDNSAAGRNSKAGTVPSRPAGATGPSTRASGRGSTREPASVGGVGFGPGTPGSADTPSGAAWWETPKPDKKGASYWSR